MISHLVLTLLWDRNSLLCTLGLDRRMSNLIRNILQGQLQQSLPVQRVHGSASVLTLQLGGDDSMSNVSGL